MAKPGRPTGWRKHNPRAAKQLRVMLTYGERRELEEIAKRRGETLSQYARRVLFSPTEPGTIKRCECPACDKPEFRVRVTESGTYAHAAKGASPWFKGVGKCVACGFRGEFKQF